MNSETENNEIDQANAVPLSTSFPLGSCRRRTGKVARLPKPVRDQINQMLLDGLPYSEILQKLGEQVQHISDDNLSNWKAGGYQDWLREQQRVEMIRFRQEFAIDLVGNVDPSKVHQATLQVAAANMVELLVDLDPITLRETLENEPDKYTRLLNAIARLSDGEIKCERHRTNEAERQAKIAKDRALAEKKGGISPEALKAAKDALKLM